MTKKNTWRLAKLPTPDELVNLVNNKIITNEEAKEILLSQEDERGVEGLEKEVEFLRNLVQKLSQNKQIIETIRYIEKPYRNWDWYQPYMVYCSANDNTYVLPDAFPQTVLTANAQVSNFADISTF